MADESPSPINLMAKVEQANFPKKKKKELYYSYKAVAEKNGQKKPRFLRAKNPPPLPKCKDGPLFL